MSYQYSGGSGLKTQMVDSSGTSSYTYDTQGRLETYTPPLPSNYKVEYSYDAADDKTSVVVKYNDSGWINKYKTAYEYFKNGWIKQVKGQEYVSDAWTDRTRVDFTYDADGRRTDRDNGLTLNDVLTDYAYNASGEMKSITHNKSGDLYKLEYIRDGLGNPLQVAFSGSQFSQPYTNANKARYEYDAISRLTKEDWGHLSGGSWYSDTTPSTWSYDWVGNRNPSSHTYNAADELNPDGSGAGDYLYDELGNVKYDPNSSASTRTRYYYNGDNLLSQVDDVTGGGTTTTYLTWDADYERVKLARGNDTWEMIYDPTAGVPAVLLAKNYVNSTTTYMYNVGEPGGTLLASFDDAGTPNKYYYHTDNLGSAVLVTDGAGTKVSSYTYGAWGDIPASSGTDLRPYQYVGELGYYKHTSGQGTALADLMQLGVRFYDTEVGRFTQRDPLRSVAGPDPYDYASNSPTRRTDPSGLIDTACPNCMAAYNQCASDALKKKDRCLAAINMTGFGEGVVACVIGCAIGCLASGPLDIPCTIGCAAGCASGIAIWAIIGLARSYFQCVRPYNEDMKVCDRFKNQCPHGYR